MGYQEFFTIIAIKFFLFDFSLVKSIKEYVSSTPASSPKVTRTPLKDPFCQGFLITLIYQLCTPMRFQFINFFLSSLVGGLLCVSWSVIFTPLIRAEEEKEELLVMNRLLGSMEQYDALNKKVISPVGDSEEPSAKQKAANERLLKDIKNFKVRAEKACRKLDEYFRDRGLNEDSIAKIMKFVKTNQASPKEEEKPESIFTTKEGTEESPLKPKGPLEYLARIWDKEIWLSSTEKHSAKQKPASEKLAKDIESLKAQAEKASKKLDDYLRYKGLDEAAIDRIMKYAGELGKDMK